MACNADHDGCGAIYFCTQCREVITTANAAGPAMRGLDNPAQLAGTCPNGCKKSRPQAKKKKMRRR